MDPDYAVKYKNPLYGVEEGELEHFKITLYAHDPVDQSSVCIEKEFLTRKGMAGAQEVACKLALDLKNCINADEVTIRKIHNAARKIHICK